MKCRESVVRKCHCLLLGLLSFFICIVCSCTNSEERKVAKIIKNWEGRKILMPKESVFTLCGDDTVAILEADTVADYICWSK